MNVFLHKYIEKDIFYLLLIKYNHTKSVTKKHYISLITLKKKVISNKTKDRQKTRQKQKTDKKTNKKLHEKINKTKNK